MVVMPNIVVLEILNLEILLTLKMNSFGVMKHIVLPLRNLKIMFTRIF